MIRTKWPNPSGKNFPRRMVKFAVVMENATLVLKRRNLDVLARKDGAMIMEEKIVHVPNQKKNVLLPFHEKYALAMEIAFVEIANVIRVSEENTARKMLT